MRKNIASLRIKYNYWNLDEILPSPNGFSSPHFYRKSQASNIVQSVIPKISVASNTSNVFKMFKVSEEMIENFSTLLYRDVFSEGDAQALYDHLAQRQHEFSNMFLVMLQVWLKDELKHYEALRRVFHYVSGIQVSEIDRLSSQRVHQFQPIEPLLVDEFTILVTMMFDEIGSVYSYRRDLQEYYSHFGPKIHKIGHHLVMDEGMHFSNAAMVLLAHHTDRFHQVESLLYQISDLEHCLGTYYQSFFLDHAQEQFRFPEQFNSLMIQQVLARLGLGKQPSASALKEMWRWTPPV